MAGKDSFPALTGFYRWLFLYIEPSACSYVLEQQASLTTIFTPRVIVLTMLPCFFIWTFPGAAWFHHELIPDGTASPAKALEARTEMSILQLGNCASRGPAGEYQLSYDTFAFY